MATGTGLERNVVLAEPLTPPPCPSGVSSSWSLAEAGHQPLTRPVRVTPGTGLSVVVDDVEVALQPAHPFLPRLDLIANIDRYSIVVTGVPAACPTLSPVATLKPYKWIAVVTVDPGQVQVSQRNITNATQSEPVPPSAPPPRADPALLRTFFPYRLTRTAITPGVTSRPQATTRAVIDRGGVFGITAEDFTTTCRTFAVAVAAELDRVDPLP